MIDQFAVLHPREDRLRSNAVRRDHSDEIRALLHLQRELALIKADLKFRRLLRSLKAYNPDQPRVPAGNPDGGQWTNAGGLRGRELVRLAGDVPTNDAPEIPKLKPPTARERTRIIRQLARYVVRVLALDRRLSIALTVADWVYEYYPYIDAYRDPPKTLDELQDAVSDPKPGYDVHHIVEQTSARQDGYPDQMIDSPDNLVRIPTLKHWEINAWYQTKNEQYGNLSPRDYLRGKSWPERYRVGLDALRKFEVLDP